MTLYLDCPVAVGLERKAHAAQRGGEWNRIDQKSVDYHERVRQGYLALAQAEPSRWLIVDAMPSPAAVQRHIRTLIESRLEDLWRPVLRR